MVSNDKDFKEYKSDYKPVWCPGCGHFSILSSTLKAMANLGLHRKDTAIVSGIGCSSRVPAYTSVYGFHSIHGRALPIATGLKMSRPDLNVIVFSGDGDALSIGGNHFIHTARRDTDLTFIIMDNEVYGMTKGQGSPTSPSTWQDSKLTPEGSGFTPFNPITLALTSGASFVARGFSGNPKELQDIIDKGVRHKGFSVIQVLSPCVTFVPEQKLWKNQVESLKTEPTVTLNEAYSLLAQGNDFTCGIFFQKESNINNATLKHNEENLEIADKYKETELLLRIEQEFCL